MALKAITINTDTAQDPHIYAIDDAEIFNSIIGGEGVHNWEENFAAEIIDNNTVRIKSGVLNIQGHFARTGKEEYTDITIENGSQTLNRNDLIVAEFRTDSGIDNIGFKVIKGESSEYAEDPGYVQEDLLSNGLVRQLPLYRVVINKLVLESLQPMFSPLPTLAQLTDMQEEIEQLNSDLTNFSEIKLGSDGIRIFYNNIIAIVQIGQSMTLTGGNVIQSLYDLPNNIAFIIATHHPCEVLNSSWSPFGNSGYLTLEEKKISIRCNESVTNGVVIANAVIPRSFLRIT